MCWCIPEGRSQIFRSVLRHLGWAFTLARRGCWVYMNQAETSMVIEASPHIVRELPVTDSNSIILA